MSKSDKERGKVGREGGREGRKREGRKREGRKREGRKREVRAEKRKGRRVG